MGKQTTEFYIERAREKVKDLPFIDITDPTQVSSGTASHAWVMAWIKVDDPPETDNGNRTPQLDGAAQADLGAAPGQ